MDTIVYEGSNGDHQQQWRPPVKVENLALLSLDLALLKARFNNKEKKKWYISLK